MALINPKSCVTRALFGFVKLRPPAMAPRVAKRAFSVRGYDSPVPRPCASRVATCIRRETPRRHWAAVLSSELFTSVGTYRVQYAYTS